jgi:hypothetical protein
MKIIYSLLILLTLPFSVMADSLTLTCDFTYYQNDGVYNSIPEDCTANLKNNLFKKNGGKPSWHSTYSKYLEPEEYLLAIPPLCPTGYHDLEIDQASIIANSGLVFSYQIRRICLENK